MSSKTYSYSSSASSTMFSNGKQKIIYGKSHKNQTINNKPTKTTKSFVKLVENKHKTKGLIGSKTNSNPWKLIKIDSSIRKPNSPKKPKSLRKPKKPKSLRKPRKPNSPKKGKTLKS